jgi:hypothetical protein
MEGWRSPKRFQRKMRNTLVQPNRVSPQSAPWRSMTGKNAVRFPAIVSLPDIKNVEGMGRVANSRRRSRHTSRGRPPDLISKPLPKLLGLPQRFKGKELCSFGCSDKFARPILHVVLSGGKAASESGIDHLVNYLLVAKGIFCAGFHLHLSVPLSLLGRLWTQCSHKRVNRSDVGFKGGQNSLCQEVAAGKRQFQAEASICRCPMAHHTTASTIGRFLEQGTDVCLKSFSKTACAGTRPKLFRDA